MALQDLSVRCFISYASVCLILVLAVVNLTPYLFTHTQPTAPSRAVLQLSTIPNTFEHLSEMQDLGPAGDEIWSSALLPTEGGFLWVQTNSTEEEHAKEGWGITMFHALHCLQMMREVFKMAVLPEHGGVGTHHPSDNSKSSGKHHHDVDPKHVTHCFSYLYQVRDSPRADLHTNHNDD